MENIAIVGEVVAGQSATLRKRMRILAADLTKHTFDLAEAFLLAQETRCYTEWGFESLPEYAELELGIKPRKAQYLARIAKVCRDCGVARKDYEPVGVTKSREITRLDPTISYYNAEEKHHEPLVDHIVRLIAEAPELSLVEIELEVARLQGMTGDNAMVMRAFKVTLSCWENVIAPCLESIRRRLGSAGRDGTGAAKEYTDGNCYEALCAEYSADPRNFMEDADESHVQIEVPEENNVRNSSSTLDAVDSAEVPQEQLQGSHQPLVVRTEE